MGREPGSWSPAEMRQLTSLASQAAALADLSHDTLEEIVTQASSVAEAEWRAEWPLRHQGRAVLLDLEVESPDGRHVAHTFVLAVPGQTARLDLDNLPLLRGLGPQKTRVLLLARLASVTRSQEHGWVIQLDPDSAVFLTEAGPARICCPALVGPEFEAVLKRQRLRTIGAGED